MQSTVTVTKRRPYKIIGAKRYVQRMPTPLHQRKKCGSPALKGENFCFYHTTARKRQKHTADNQPYDRVNPKNTALALPSVDEGDAIQLAISEVVLALAANTIDPRRARILLYGLQIASQHYRLKINSTGAPFKPAVGLSGDVQDIVRETCMQEDGAELGPEKQSPDPEDLCEDDGPMTLGKFLLLEAINKGLIDPDKIRDKEQEWKDFRRGFKTQPQNKPTVPVTVDLKAVAEEPAHRRTPRCRRRATRNPRALTTLEKTGGTQAGCEKRQSPSGFIPGTEVPGFYLEALGAFLVWDFSTKCAAGVWLGVTPCLCETWGTQSLDLGHPPTGFIPGTEVPGFYLEALGASFWFGDFAFTYGGLTGQRLPAPGSNQ